MTRRHNLRDLDWTLTGWMPYLWRLERSVESGASTNADVPAIPVRVPGSVQGALRDAGVIPDWNVGLNARLCEWVENRHWIYTALLPDEWIGGGSVVRLRALGLDYSGWLLLNGREIDRFVGSFVPHVFDLTPHLGDRDNILQIVFDCPPRWLGQIGYTSQMSQWKPRFNYFWDWTSRLVQLGIWDDLLLESTDGEEITSLDCRTSASATRDSGTLRLSAEATGGRSHDVLVLLERDGRAIMEEEAPIDGLIAGLVWDDLPVERWWPNGSGDQPLYTLRCWLLDESGTVLDEASRRIGFKSVEWRPCEGAPSEADPWLCVVNGEPTFLQGVNWTPIRPNFADVTDGEYRRLLETYRDLGCNMLRLWGGAFLEKQVFYDLCDELGLMVWQEFPLSSSGLENSPPDDPVAIEEMAAIAESYIVRRRHHVSLTIWCGGNELQGEKPIDASHPMIAHLQQVVSERAPERRFLPTSPSGPSFSADEENFGKGMHWDVHGPWSAKGNLDEDWTRYWRNNDGLFHSEIGVPAASSVEIIRAYKGAFDETPGTAANPLWRRTSWWIEWPVFVRENGREPNDLGEYVAWSQERQRRALDIAARACKARFPRCGGFLIWMGHDSFPCTANTSIIDFNGNPKPAALAVRDVYRRA